MFRFRVGIDETPISDDLWQIHAAQVDWTGKVDAKATFALTLQAGLLAAAVVLLPDMKTGLEYGLMAAAGAFIFVGAVFAAMVVTPQLRSKSVSAEARSNYIYFGHARGWHARKLVKHLRKHDISEQIARQIIVMADIAWKKHRRVAVSVWLSVLGGALLIAAAVLSRLSE